MKKISIIIPLYNAEKYIQKTIDSILIQKDRIFEIIIIDDGSNDNSSEIIKNNYGNEEKIKYYYQKNSGAPIARNLGISKATGDYVIFFDSDDILIDKTIEKYCNILNSNDDIDLIIGNYNKIDEKDNILSKELLFKKDEIIIDKNIFEYSNIDPKPGNKIYSLKIIKKNKIVFDDVKIGQDLNFFLKYILFSNKIYLLNEYVFNYRIVDTSISRTYSMKILNIKDTFDCVKKYYEKENCINLYFKYISTIEMINYYYQYCKVRYFKNKDDRKKILKFFRINARSLKLHKKTMLFKRVRTIYLKFIVRLFIGKIFISNIYCNYVINKRGGRHI